MRGIGRLGRFIFISLIAFMAIAFFGIGFGMYIYMKRTIVSGKPLIEQPVNKQTRTDKMGIGEWLVYASAILAALLFTVRLRDKGGTGFSNLAKFIVLPPVMALFNARKRTGRSMVALITALMLTLFLMMTYLIIGVPQKAPVLTVNNTPITIAHTTAGDVLKEGFDIYIRKDDRRVKYEDLVSSETFKKCPANRSVLVEKGFCRDASYLLVKDNIVIGNIGLYGDKNKDIVLEDCKIIRFQADTDYIEKVKANAGSYQLSGINLLAPLKQETLQQTFGKKLWLVPPANPIDITQLQYGIQWSSGNGHLFWNEYYAYIRFDENNDMTGFELSTEIARDWNE